MNRKLFTHLSVPSRANKGKCFNIVVHTTTSRKSEDKDVDDGDARAIIPETTRLNANDYFKWPDGGCDAYGIMHVFSVLHSLFRKENQDTLARTQMPNGTRALAASNANLKLADKSEKVLLAIDNGVMVCHKEFLPFFFSAASRPK